MQVQFVNGPLCLITCMKLNSEMLYVGGGQPQSLNLAQLPVQRLRGDQLSQAGERGVDALGSVSLTHVGDHSGFFS